jgi:chromosomal replication initiator protein
MIDRRFNTKNQNLILALVSEEFSCEPEDLFIRNRSARNSNARHVAMSLMRVLLDCTLVEIAILFKRDHSTVIHAKKKVDFNKKLQESALKIAKKYKNMTEQSVE